MDYPKQGITNVANGVLGSVNILTKPLQLIGEKVRSPSSSYVFTTAQNNYKYKTASKQLKEAYENYKDGVSQSLGEVYGDKKPWKSSVAFDTFLTRDLELIDNNSIWVRMALFFKFLLFILLFIMILLEMNYSRKINNLAKDNQDKNNYKLTEQYFIMDQDGNATTNEEYIKSIDIKALNKYNKLVKYVINGCLFALTAYEIYRGYGKSFAYVNSKRLKRTGAIRRDINSVISTRSDDTSNSPFNLQFNYKNNKIATDIPNN